MITATLSDRPSMLPSDLLGIPKATIDSMPRVVAAYRVVSIFTVVALLWKWSFFVAASNIYASIPVVDPLFPAWLQSVWTLRIAFMGIVASLIVGVLVPSSLFRHVAAWGAFLGATVLVLHQGSHNDMTFATA